MRSKLFAGAGLAITLVMLSAQPSVSRDAELDPVAASPMCSNEAASVAGKETSPETKAPPKMLAGYGDNGFVSPRRAPRRSAGSTTA